MTTRPAFDEGVLSEGVAVQCCFVVKKYVGVKKRIVLPSDLTSESVIFDSALSESGSGA